jgi:high-affinity nickel-transport protein
MMLITMAVALPFAYAEPRVGRFGERLRIPSGVVSLGFGLFLAYQAGVVHGLFSGSPRWTPQ